jgi:predicted small secreted protein
MIKELSPMNTPTFRRLVCTACLAAFAFALSATLAGCNTVKGVGRDVEAMAQGGQDIIDGKRAK